MISAIEGLKLIAQSLIDDKPRSDSLKFLLFQADSIHSDLNAGQQLTDAVWRRNPNGTVSIDRPPVEEDTSSNIQSQFILPAGEPQLLKAEPNLPPEAISLINYVIDRYERPKPKGVVLLSAGMGSAPNDWQMDLYTAVTRENAYQLALKGVKTEGVEYPLIDFRALHDSGIRFIVDGADQGGIKEAVLSPKNQEIRQNREVNTTDLYHVFPRERKPKPMLEAPSGDIMQQLAALGLVKKQ